jgi:hypothetical protein
MKKTPWLEGVFLFQALVPSLVATAAIFHRTVTG